MVIISSITSLCIILVSLAFHEYAHAYFAYKLGDTTPKYEGRLTLNPFVHVDIYWTLLVPLVLSVMGLGVFGWAKPVSINPLAFKKPNSGEALVAFAWPFTNFLIAFVWIFLLLIYLKIFGLDVGVVLRFGLSDFGLFFFQQLVFINLFLWFFNLLPIPPLDGFRLIKVFCYPLYSRMLRHSSIILIVFVVLIIWPLRWVIGNWLETFSSLFFSFFYSLFSQLFF